MSRIWLLIPPRPSVIARMAPPVETVKMVMSCVAFTFFRILSRVILEKVSRPEAMRMMYLRPSMRLEPVERLHTARQRGWSR